MNDKDRFVEKIKKYLAKNGCETDKIDVFAEYDSGITFEENRNVFHEKYVATRIKTEPTKADIEINQVREHDCIVALENEYERVHQEAIEVIKNTKTTDVLEKAYATIKEFTKTLAISKRINGLILESSTGLGKTFNVTKALSEMGLKINEQFVVLTGYTTPLELFQFLYHNRDKIIIMDDIRTIFESERAIGMLLSALYHPSNRRVISYLSSTDKLDVPKTFEFVGKIVWCVNDLPKGIDNIKSRCLYYPFNFSYKEVIEILYEVAKTKDIPSYIVDYIKEKTNESYRVDLRLAEKLNEIRVTLGDDKWKKYADEILGVEVDEEMKVLIECLTKNALVKEACREFIELTGSSRRTFFRRKKLYEEKKRSPRWRNVDGSSN